MLYSIGHRKLVCLKLLKKKKEKRLNALLNWPQKAGLSKTSQKEKRKKGWMASRSTTKYRRIVLLYGVLISRMDRTWCLPVNTTKIGDSVSLIFTDQYFFCRDVYWSILVGSSLTMSFKRVSSSMPNVCIKVWSSCRRMRCYTQYSWYYSWLSIILVLSAAPC